MCPTFKWKNKNQYLSCQVWSKELRGVDSGEDRDLDEKVNEGNAKVRGGGFIYNRR